MKVDSIQVIASSSDWPLRVLLSLAVVLAIALTLALMRKGWLRRAARQTDVAALGIVPSLPTTADPRDVTRCDARYVGASRAGDWLDRIVVHGLGVPSPASISVRVAGPVGSQPGVWVERVGAPDLFVPAESISGVRHDRGVAARAFERDGVLILTWNQGSTALDVGLRIRDTSEAERIRAAIAALTTVATIPGDHT